LVLSNFTNQLEQKLVFFGISKSLIEGIHFSEINVCNIALYMERNANLTK
jgi:hypothetical protein